MFSIRAFTRAAIRAISAIPSSVNVSVAPSAPTRAAYCFVSAFSGSVMIRTKSASVNGLTIGPDFVRAANRSNGGKSFIVLPSTAKSDTISRIVPTLQPGTHVSTGKNDINYVVTEYGVAQLRGKTAKQRCQALIGIAHPDFRGELREVAKKMKLL